MIVPFMEEASEEEECPTCETAAWIRVVWANAIGPCFAIFCELCGKLLDASPEPGEWKGGGSGSG